MNDLDEQGDKTWENESMNIDYRGLVNNIKFPYFFAKGDPNNIVYGFGLKVTHEYDNGDDNWLSMKFN